MPKANLKTPRTMQRDALSTQALSPNEAAKAKLMSWAQWSAIPRKFRIERGATRCVMEHTQHGIVLHAVHITG
jgi:hypothetical protein